VFGASATMVYGAVGELIGAQARAINSRGFVVKEGAATAMETAGITARRTGRCILVILD
jgi:hypothetical protein